MKRRIEPTVTHAEFQSQLGRCITQLRLAKQIAEAKSADGLSEDLFMIQCEIQRILSSTRDERSMTRYGVHRHHVSQTRMEP